MNIKNISDFYKEDAPAYAAADNIRKIASYIDGLKLSARKILYTLFEKYPTGFIKTSQFANYVAGFTNYNQGENNLAGVCGTMAQSFVGANNYPLLCGKGGWGNRLDPFCAAPRYTHVSANINNKIFFNKDDRQLVVNQIYEGDKIEPLYYVPVLPILLLNGSEGLSTGFKQQIFPRNIKDIISYIEKKLKGEENPKIEFLPWFRDFKGCCKYDDEGKLKIFGKVEKNTSTSYTIVELPIGLSYVRYCEILNDLCDNNIIVDFKDLCDPKTNAIKFTIKTTREFTNINNTDDLVLQTLKLVKPCTEIFNAIDENNRVREFKSVKEILDAFIKIRLDFYENRKNYLISTTKNSLDKLYSKYLFCKGVIDETIEIRNVSKDNICNQLENIKKIIKIDNSYNYLLNIPISSITKNGLDEMKETILALKAQYKNYKDKPFESFWIDDINQIKKLIK